MSVTELGKTSMATMQKLSAYGGPAIFSQNY
jgi:hypothetical protein